MYRWAEHTGELELEIRTQSEDEVYAQALEAMAELLGDERDQEPAPREEGPASRGPEHRGDGALREVTLEAEDRPRLLADFVGELAFLAETEGFVPVALERLDAQAGRLRATVRGRLEDSPHLVKAATYHRLSFEALDGGWHARVVLDV